MPGFAQQRQALAMSKNSVVSAPGNHLIHQFGRAPLHRFGETPDVSANCEGHAAHIARNTMCAGMLPTARLPVTPPPALKAEPGVNWAPLSQLASVRAPWGCKRRRLELCSQH